jgi:hypothetical protein
MGNTPNGSKDKNCGSWTEEEGRNSNSDSRRGGNTRCQGESTGYQSERINRTNSSEFNFTKPRRTIAGGMLCHFIDDYREQVALKKAERERLDSDILRLEARISELELLQSELEDRIKENP